MTNYNKPIYWISNLRAIAVIAVIILHVSFEGFYNYGNYSLNKWLTATFFDSISRFCVPIFLMITGALLLGKDETLSTFYKKRFSKIIYPFIFWSLIYYIFIYYPTFSKESLVQIFFNLFIALRNGVSYHFWYVYMLIGIYIIIPVLSKWIKNAPKSEISFFLILWGLIQFSYYPHFGIIHNIIDLRYVTGYIGYPVLGYFLSNIVSDEFKSKKIISTFIFLFGIFATFGLTVFETLKTNKFNEFYFGYNTFNVIIQSIGIFLTIKYFLYKQIIVFDKINKYSYGIYLIHVLVLQILNNFGINSFLIHPIIGILSTSILCLSMSLTIIYGASKIPILKNFVN